MSALKALNIATLPKISSNDPALKRRVKLLVQLEQQLQLANNPNYVVSLQKWRKQEDGSKLLVERQKRVKKWWVEDIAGNMFFTVRYGAKLIEFEKGKAAIAVGDKDNLISVVEAVISAVRNGEFDALLAATQRVAQKPKAKAA